MNTGIAQKRMNEVLMVDSINSTEPDFLATHVPFRTIKVKRGLNNDNPGETISEDTFFSQYFESLEMYQRHQFIVVEGCPGSGKSNFIRWIDAKLRSFEGLNDVVLLIRRDDNTLKGTIRQLLTIPEVKNIQNKEAYERLVKANQAISEQKFKDSIYQSFQVEIRNDESETKLNNVTKKNLIALLSNDLFEEKMKSPGGPIDRIYNKVTSSSAVSSQDALFYEADFVLDTDFGEELRINGADKKAIKMADKLIPDDEGSSKAEMVSEYLNSLVDNVIQSCAGIEPGDFQQIFKEIRQELYRKNKNLILLIEDVTSFTGINQALLNALETEHNGLYESEHLCRLISVVGTTTEYYKQFRDNYRDRITTQITIEDGTIGKNNIDLRLFFAKYLNAMSVAYEEVESWYKSGANESDLPIAESNIAWSETLVYQGKKYDLFPFTAQSITNLFYNLGDHKTPRTILREIIEPAIHNLIYDKNHFPKFLQGKSSNLTPAGTSRIMNIVNNMAFDNEEEKISYRDRALSFVGFWGNGSLQSDKKQVAGIPREMFDYVSLGDFAKKFEAGEIIEPTLLHVPVKEDNQKVVPKKYNDFLEAINEWYYDKKVFPSARGEIRDAICSFIFETINWQQEGIPLDVKRMVDESSITLVAIERQERGIERGLIILDDSDETYNLLLCFTRWIYLGNKSWNYSGYQDVSPGSDILTVTSWLDSHKKKIVDAVLEYKKGISDYVLMAMSTDLCFKLLTGDIDCNSLENISVNTFIKPITNHTESLCAGHSQGWIDLIEFIASNKKAESNHQSIVNYFNLIQGVSSNASKYIIHYSLLEEAVKILKKNKGFIFNDQKSRFKGLAEIIDLNSKTINKIARAIQEEIKDAKETANNVLQYWGYDFDSMIDKSDIRDMMNDIKMFYSEAEQYGIPIKYKYKEAEAFKADSAELASYMEILAIDYSEFSNIDILFNFAQNPIQKVKNLLFYLNEVEKDVQTVSDQMKSEKEKQIQQGLWTEDVDPRFTEIKDEFITLKGGALS